MGSLHDSPKDSPVPIIDFSKFLNAESHAEKKQTANDIYTAFREVGFVYLVNHGIPLEKVNECFNWSKKFFDLPLEEKMKCPHPPSGSYHRGYSGIGKEKASQMVFDRDNISEVRKVPDVKESFECSREDDDLYPNIWPDPATIPGFADFCMDYYWTARKTQINILHSIAIGMGLEEDYFDPFHTDAQNQLRLLHYPSVEEESLRKGEKERIGAHSDFGTLTILVQDQCGGLEVQDPRSPGCFVPAPPVDGAIIVNIGDFLMRWSNDNLKSTLHRVRAPPIFEGTNDEVTGRKMTAPRYSIPYFCGANRDATIDCIPGCWSETKPKKYDPINSEEYIAMRLNATY
ncbi:MAG: hypothetical protein M1819_003072 [Sarea resinae]|nr:MAG: hypothetical protein M1819_003072 [Sarea resinae]